METTKTNTKGRVKHLFPRKELYHVFIHSEQYAYSPAGKYQISCIHNCLFIGCVDKSLTIENIKDRWGYFSTKTIAVINRNLKRIIINTTYDCHLYDLLWSIPDDYKVFKFDESIQDLDNIYNIEHCYYNHCKHLVKELVNDYLINAYAVIHKLKVTYKGYYPNKLIELQNYIKDNDIKKYSWYNESFDNNYKLRVYKSSWNYNSIIIKLPTLRQIYTNTIFTGKEKLYLAKREFYTKYCYSNNIPFKDIDEYWNDTMTMPEAIKYFNSKRLTINADWFEERDFDNKFTSFIKIVVNTNIRIVNNIYRENIAKSKANREEALCRAEEIRANEYTIDNWRAGNINNISTKILYRRFITKNIRSKLGGKWIDDCVYVNSSLGFSNIVLRLHNSNIIQTSNNASVTIEEGIRMYKLFNRLRKANPNTINFTSSDFGKVYVGIYNLRFITYKDKVTDKGVSLGRKEWLIQIGCHSIWLDDVEDFIRYYHLEDKFGLI